jgi:hypothetical protein
LSALLAIWNQNLDLEFALETLLSREANPVVAAAAASLQLADVTDANALDPDLREDTMGGAQAVQRFARLFMIPTMYHCNGGYGPSQFDMVGPIVDWVEQDEAPDERARHTGSGSIDDAASFVAADPASPPDDHVDWLGSDLLRPRGRHA